VKLKFIKFAKNGLIIQELVHDVKYTSLMYFYLKHFSLCYEFNDLQGK